MSIIDDLRNHFSAERERNRQERLDEKRACKVTQRELEQSHQLLKETFDVAILDARKRGQQIIDVEFEKTKKKILKLRAGTKLD